MSLLKHKVVPQTYEFHVEHRVELRASSIPDSTHLNVLLNIESQMKIRNASTNMYEYGAEL